jgi:hypothetical protein
MAMVFGDTPCSCTVQIYAQHNKVPEEKSMEAVKENASTQLAWAVLSKAVNGRSEVIKVTDHEGADQLVRENPGSFYKTGPFLLA